MGDVLRKVNERCFGDAAESRQQEALPWVFGSAIVQVLRHRIREVSAHVQDEGDLWTS